MTLLREIQKDAVDPNVDVATLLRKCKILAARLKHKQFNDWIENELNGYKSKNELPEYRIMGVQSYGHFSGPFGSGIKNGLIPPMCIPESARELITTVYLTDGIGSYTKLAAAKEDNLTIMWPADLVALVGQKIYEHMSCLGAWQRLPQGSLIALIETVRNKILSFVLEIEGANPNAGDVLPSETPIPTDRVNQIYNTYITGNIGNFASGQNPVQTTYNIEIGAGDFAELTKELEKHGIDKEDIAELKTALDTDTRPTQKDKFGSRVAGWMGKIVTKAASGVLKVSSTVVTNVLTKAISDYYGLK